jgi:serine incorporator 1/3
LRGAGAGILLAWFKPAGAGSCSFNVAVIVSSLILFLSFTVVSVSPLLQQGSLFSSAVISLYTMYLTYSALQSEPHDEKCNGLGHRIDAASGSMLAVGTLIMLLSVVYSAFKCEAALVTMPFAMQGAFVTMLAAQPFRHLYVLNALHSGVSRTINRK